MQVSHTNRTASASFTDPNLVSSAGLVPIMKLAARAGLATLADQWLSVPTDKGTNAGLKVTSLVGGMVAGADSIDDLAILRHGGMRKIFTNCYAPSTLGSFLREFTFGHVRQLDAVASRFARGLAAEAPLVVHDTDGYISLDIDDTIIEVHGYQKEGSGVRGLNVFLATLKTDVSAPILIGQRLRRGACGSPRGAARLIRDALATTQRLRGAEKARVLFRADSAFYSHASSVRRSKPAPTSRSPLAWTPPSNEQEAKLPQSRTTLAQLAEPCPVTEGGLAGCFRPPRRAVRRATARARRASWRCHRP